MSNQIFVRDVMKTTFDMMDGLCTVREALKRMQHVQTKTLIIDKRSEHDEYGIVVIGDIAQLIAENRSPNRVSLYEIMNKPTVSVHAEMNIRYASQLFLRFGLSRAPVLDEKRQIIGMVSLTDMVLKGLTHLE
ncbi:MAG: CBS domain-containing protein [Mariprofundaceae bacterium]|nr:CBS domain-containing protein [Mariprofundaceae bacterium]